MTKKLIVSLCFTLLLASCTINYHTEPPSSQLPENPTIDNPPNQAEKPRSQSSVNYHELFQQYMPPEGESQLYQVSRGKTDEGISVENYILIDRFTIPSVTGVILLAHRADTDVCQEWTSFDISELTGQVLSIVDQESTPEELSELAEIVYQA